MRSSPLSPSSASNIAKTRGVACSTTVRAPYIKSSVILFALQNSYFRVRLVFLFVYVQPISIGWRDRFELLQHLSKVSVCLENVIAKSTFFLPLLTVDLFLHKLSGRGGTVSSVVFRKTKLYYTLVSLLQTYNL